MIDLAHMHNGPTIYGSEAVNDEHHSVRCEAHEESEGIRRVGRAGS